MRNFLKFLGAYVWASVFAVGLLAVWGMDAAGRVYSVITLPHWALQILAEAFFGAAVVHILYRQHQVLESLEPKFEKIDKALELLNGRVDRVYSFAEGANRIAHFRARLEYLDTKIAELDHLKSEAESAWSTELTAWKTDRGDTLYHAMNNAPERYQQAIAKMQEIGRVEAKYNSDMTDYPKLKQNPAINTPEDGHFENPSHREPYRRLWWNWDHVKTTVVEIRNRLVAEQKQIRKNLLDAGMPQ